MSRDPEVVAHQPAGLVEHLPPLGGRVDGDDDPPGVDLELVGVARSSGALGAGAVGAQHAQRLAVAHDQPGAVAADRVRAHRVGDHVELAAHQVVALQHRALRLARRCRRGRRRARPRPAMRYQSRQSLPRLHPAVAGRRRPGSARPGRPAPRRRRRPRAARPCPRPSRLRGLRDVLGALRGRVVGLGRRQVVGPLVRRARRGRPSGLAPNGDGRARGQRHQERPPGRREGQVERVLVVDRVEAAPGQEGQVACRPW